MQLEAIRKQLRTLQKEWVLTWPNLHMKYLFDFHSMFRVTKALMHAEDSLIYMSALRGSSIFRFCAIPQIMAIGTLALCYNNIEVFRGCS
ncbi:squalene synthase-like [Phaseolus vulgaris]|uniref:squalene synthase-like n=1 Tax=Phaseolus vulgaris TaxID=3885 RepID=UPI0035CAB64A